MTKHILKKRTAAKRRAIRTRAKVHGTQERPRLTVFRSGAHIYAQVINDDAGTTLAASSDLALKVTGRKPLELAALVGEDVAKKAKSAGVGKIVFDRGPYLYHGRVKAVALAAREVGLEF